ncbi:MAG: DNA/RNA endonuclease [uncultured Aureispira sp.]|uniref:Endonuclease n=1 Tax=uncultured Aureispira sp. TaxID=1331704 RepID=A0A6S6TWI5_9BACT|nr:MAG: DNA/RNA endonuclease [uncultured Aureispira sp.]
MAKKKNNRSTKTTQDSNTDDLQDMKPKRSWQRKITTFFTAILGAGTIAFFTPLFGVLDDATGGLLTDIWSTVATIEDEVTNIDDNKDIPTPNINDFQEDKTIGLPAFQVGDQMVVTHKSYVLRYNEVHEQAEWVAHTLLARHLKGDNPRRDNFKTDPDVATKTAKPTDYARSGYDRGHLAPAADFKYSAEAISESFYMSNMSPQLPAFNRGMWKGLENKVREWATAKKQLYIVSGPVLKKYLRKIGTENKISVPKQFYKIVVHLDPNHPHAIAFLMPNKLCEGFYDDYRVSIDEIEALTQIDFFSKLPDDLENYLEQSNTSDRWFDTPEAIPSPY